MKIPVTGASWLPTITARRQCLRSANDSHNSNHYCFRSNVWHRNTRTGNVSFHPCSQLSLFVVPHDALPFAASAMAPPRWVVTEAFALLCSDVSCFVFTAARTIKHSLAWHTHISQREAVYIYRVVMVLSSLRHRIPVGTHTHVERIKFAAIPTPIIQ